MILETLIIPISLILRNNFQKDDAKTTIELEPDDYFRAERDLMETWMERTGGISQPKIKQGTIEVDFNGLTFIIKRKEYPLRRREDIRPNRF